MQIFSCPFCGPRPEYEFHFGGDLGNLRPEGPDVPANIWAEYLYFRNNPKGAAQEIWQHIPCGELFAMCRDTVTMEADPGRALSDEEAQP
jgi:sarcosine oxidase subunit delta